MSSSLTQRFSDQQLQTIIEQAMIYMCACPAQVAEQILRLRGLFAYQQQCMGTGGATEVTVHQAIADATEKAHTELENCLHHVLDLEGWDRTTMLMPSGLRQLLDAQIERS